jgi:CBS domain-containing protein
MEHCYNIRFQPVSGYQPMHKLPHLATSMTPFPYSIGLDSLLTDALALMEQHNVRHLPVTEGRTVVGILTDRDIRFAIQAGKAEKNDPEVRSLCVKTPYIVSLDEPLDAVLLFMAEKHIDSAIVTKNGKLAGMFTTVDACRCFSEFLRMHSSPPAGDEAA